MTISNENDRLTIIIPKYLKDQIKDLADREKRSMGNYVAHILEDHVKQKQQIKQADMMVMEESMSYDSELTKERIRAAINTLNRVFSDKFKEHNDKNPSDN